MIYNQAIYLPLRTESIMALTLEVLLLVVFHLTQHTHTLWNTHAPNRDAQYWYFHRYLILFFYHFNTIIYPFTIPVLSMMPCKRCFGPNWSLHKLLLSSICSPSKVSRGDHKSLQLKIYFGFKLNFKHLCYCNYATSGGVLTAPCNLLCQVKMRPELVIHITFKQKWPLVLKKAPFLLTVESYPYIAICQIQFWCQFQY